MERTRIWHVLLIVFAVLLALWFATPPVRVVLERRVVTEVYEDGKIAEIPQEDVQFSSNWDWLIRDKYTERRLVSERKEGKRVERKYIEEEIGRSRIALGLDLRGGSELRYSMVGGGGLSDVEAAYEQTVATVRKRIDVHGLKEPLVQREGRDTHAGVPAGLVGRGEDRTGEGGEGASGLSPLRGDANRKW